MSGLTEFEPLMAKEFLYADHSIIAAPNKNILLRNIEIWHDTLTSTIDNIEVRELSWCGHFTRMSSTNPEKET